MSDFGDGKIVTARKDHKCKWCGELIPKGTKTYYYRGMWNGEWQNRHVHPECEAAWARDIREDGYLADDGFEPFANKRGVGITEEDQPSPVGMTL